MAIAVHTVTEAYLQGALDTSLVQSTPHPTEPLVLLNYTERCRQWNDVTRLCRGLVLHARTAEVMALPFPKFFNLGENEDRPSVHLPDEPFMVFEKVDGSLGISYRDDQGQMHLATRGSFTSPQARKGTQLLHKLSAIETVPASYTCLFEIVYPGNRGIVDYGDREELVLLGMYNRAHGEELSWDAVQHWAHVLGVRVPQVFTFVSFQDLLAARAELPASLEGFVVRFAGGLRVKLKGDAYLELYRQATGVNRKALIEALLTGELESYLHHVPEAFQGLARDIAAALIVQKPVIEEALGTYFAQAPKAGSRKEFACWVQVHVPAPYRPALFRLFDGHPPNIAPLLQAVLVGAEAATNTMP